ncbi:MAG: hypothetical protein DRG33_05335 [Deltaproteobacteria bacterium]|nr:MAG: hypothetical protein DRG33_05335 [Deltaproteobacteria bacterium]
MRLLERIRPKEKSSQEGQLIEQPTEEEKEEKKKEEKYIGYTMAPLDDYIHFQETEATASDLDSLIMLEWSIRKFGAKPGLSKIMTYVIAIIVLVIGLTIGFYIAKDLGLLPV